MDDAGSLDAVRSLEERILDLHAPEDVHEADPEVLPSMYGIVYLLAVTQSIPF